MKRVVSLDSTGTLVKISSSVGYQYLRILESFFPGALTDRDRKILTQQFNKNFPIHYKDAMKQNPNFGHGSIGCYAWWKGLVRELYLSSNIDMKDYQFSYVFDDTYHQFRSAKCWEPFPETVPVLKALKSRNIDVVVTSDFDQGLVNILLQHGLYNPRDTANSFIKEVITSYEYGVAKPELLKLVREKWNVEFHVGDSVDRDVTGAASVGVRPIFLDRKRVGSCEDHISIDNLSGIMDHLD